MFTIKGYITLIIISFVLTIILYLLRIRQYQARKLKYFIVFLLSILFLEFFFNMDVYVPKKVPNSFNETALAPLSVLFLFISFFSFLISVRAKGEDVIELKQPDFFKSRRGSIKMGKVMKEISKKLFRPWYFTE